MDLPDTPVGRQFGEWLAIFNGGDRVEFEKFASRVAIPVEQQMPVAGALALRRRTGGFVLRKIESSTPTKLAALVQERDADQFARVEMEVDTASVNRILAFGIRGIERPPEFAIPRMSQEQLVGKLRAKLETDAAADKFSGAVLVAKDGKPIFNAAYGLADREKKIANTLDTKFRIGSMNKMFTAIAALQLVQSGKIALSDPVGKYLTDYPNKDIATKVTIEQLLTHTGGTGDIFSPEYMARRLEVRTLNDYVKLYGARAPKFEPGSKWEYSNYGFVLLGVIIERVSGQDYYAYVDKHIYSPAGMTSSASLPEDVDVANRGVGYMQPTDALQPNTDTLPYRGSSAGGGYSTVGDLLRFAVALRDHKLLNAKYTDMLTTGRAEVAGGFKYAFGFGDIGRGTPLHHFGHSGGAPGMSGDLAIYPQAGYVVTALSNFDPPAADRVVAYVANRMPL